MARGRHTSDRRRRQVCAGPHLCVSLRYLRLSAVAPFSVIMIAASEQAYPCGERVDRDQPECQLPHPRRASRPGVADGHQS